MIDNLIIQHLLNILPSSQPAFDPRHDKQLSVAFLKASDREKGKGSARSAKYVDAESNIDKTEVAVKTLKGRIPEIVRICFCFSNECALQCQISGERLLEFLKITFIF